MASILEPDIEPALESMIYKLRDARSHFLDANYQQALEAAHSELLTTYTAASICWLKARA